MSIVNITADNALVQRGSFNEEQVRALLKYIHSSRVVNANGHSNLSQQDVRAHLIRIFGFGHVDVEITHHELVFEQHLGGEGKAARYDVCYAARVKLSIRNMGNVLVCQLEDGSTATAQNQTRGGGHDLAYKSAISLSLKRAATSLGDQFGLSLYNKGQTSALVKGTLVGLPKPAGEGERDMQEGIEQQVSLGNDDGSGVLDDDEQATEAPAKTALPAPRKRATNGTQGTKRAAAPTEAPEAASEAPTAAEATGPSEHQQAVAMAAEAKAAEDRERLEAEVNKRAAAATAAAAAAEAAEIEASRAQHHAAVEQAEADEREQRRLIAAEQDAMQAKREADDAAEHANMQTGEVAETGAETAARIKAEREARGAATAQAEPEPWAGEDVADMNWTRQLSEATTVAQVKAVWDGALVLGAMTTELKLAIVTRKAEVEKSLARAAAGPAEPEQTQLGA